MSLHEKLNNLISQKGTLTWLEVKKMCEDGSLGKMHKCSYAERELRPSKSPMVYTIYEGGHVKEYRWLGVRKPEPKYQMVKVQGMDLFVKVLIK